MEVLRSFLKALTNYNRFRIVNMLLRDDLCVGASPSGLESPKPPV